MNSIVSSLGKVTEVLQGKNLETDGNLGAFAVSKTAETPSDIAKAAALQYHVIDIDNSHSLFKSVVLRRKGIKSKFAKRNDDDDDEMDESEVDEATREESAPNDPKHQRVINAHIAKLAQRNADISNLNKIFG